MKDKDKLQKIFDNISTSAEISYCGPHYGKEGNKRMCFIIRWSEKGRGFGEYAFYQDDETGKWKIDNEMDGKDAIKRIMCALVDSLEIEETWNDTKGR